MKILAIHNFYQQPGGEDQVFASETRLLESHGHSVHTLTETNKHVTEMSQMQLAAATIWNKKAYQRVDELVTRECPDVVHFHNTFPLLSPACYYAARRRGGAVVQTLHNYRLICPGATLLREGKPCEDCVGHLPWRAVQHSCYRESRMASAGVAAMLTVHRAVGTWQRQVDAYIALTEFSRERFVAGGLPKKRLFIKPNFMDSDPGLGAGGRSILYAGRLSPEKGLAILIKAWRIRADLPQLRIIGDGPLGEWLQNQLVSLPHVVWLGRMPRERVVAEMQSSMALVLPSVWYENFPVSVVEAYATGLPVIGSDAGALPELVRDGITGLLFRSGDERDLADKVATVASDSALLARLKAASREEFERLYQGERNHRLLTDIYRQAIANRSTA